MSSRFRQLPLVAGLIAAAALSACVDTPTDPDPGAVATLNFRADVAGTGIEGLTAVVTAADFADPLVFNIVVVNGMGAGELSVPTGSERTFTIHAFDGGGVETHRGSTTVDVLPDDNPTLEVTLFPLLGSVPIQVSVGSVIVTVEPSELTLPIGGSFQYVAHVATSDSSPYPGEVQWASTNPVVATVDSTGVVWAWSEGETQIVASAGNASGSATLLVSSDSTFPGTGPQVFVFPFADTLQIGDTVRLAAVVIDSMDDTTAAAVTWSSQDTGVATVDSTGLVTAVGNGNAVIEAMALGATGQAYINVGGVTPGPAQVIVTPFGDTLMVGDTLQLTAIVIDSVGDTVSVAVTWSSSDTAVAVVTQLGLVYAVAPGQADIMATALGATGHSYIAVGSQAPTVILGPVYPPPGGVTLNTVGNSMADSGGVSFEFSDFDLSAVTAMAWGADSGQPVILAFDSVPDAAGEFLTYDSTASDFANGIIRWTGMAEFQYRDPSTFALVTDTVPTRLTVAVFDAAGPAMMADAANSGLPANIGGAALVADNYVTGGTTGPFVAHLEMEAFFNGSWTAANTLFNLFNTPLGHGVVTSFYGGFYYVP